MNGSNNETKYVTMRNLDKSIDNQTYYCLNKIQKTFGSECNNTMIYQLNGGFGCNFVYCQPCFAKWRSQLPKEPLVDQLKKQKPYSECKICTKPSKPTNPPKHEYKPLGKKMKQLNNNDEDLFIDD